MNLGDNQDSVHDNLEEYRDPEDYDHEYGSYEPGGPFYERLAREVGSPILELACGTGRVTIPLARQGFQVTGLDLVPEMLERARHKSEAEGLSVRWVLGDCRTFRLPECFRLIFLTGNAFQAFLTRADQEALLARVREHLLPGGLFAFETRNPTPEEVEGLTGEEEFWHTYTRPDGTEVRVSGREWYDRHTDQALHHLPPLQGSGRPGDDPHQPHRPALCWT